MTASADRPQNLRLPPRGGGGWGTMLWTLVGIVALGGIFGASAYYTAPVLISDWQIRDAARPVAEARVSDGKCTSKLVIHICDATLGLRTPKGEVSRRVNYVFTGVHVGDYSIRVAADPARPELVTTDLGLEQLWNRTLTLATIMLASAAAIVFALLGMLRSRRHGSETA